MPVINGVYLKDFAALPGAVDDANIIPIAISGNQVAYRTTVSGIITDARITGKLLTGLSVTGTAILATDTILQAFGKVQNQLNNRVSSVGLTMPSAFSVANSPVTGSGTLAVSAIGVASQYIRGDGELATLPSGGGGGSSVNYYLNGSVAASVGTYYQMSNTPVIGAGTDFTLTGNGLIAQFLTDAGNPNRLQIPAGAWNFEMFFQISSTGGNTKFYVELLKYNGSTFTSIASSSVVPELITSGTTVDLYLTSIAVPETTLLVTDRLAVRVYIVDNSGGRTVTLHTEDNTLCQVTTTFSGGIAALNGLTANTQYFAVGSTGTDFNISSSVDTHTFNIPSASASNRGLITTGTQTIAGIKTLSTSINGESLFTVLNTNTGTDAYTRSIVSNGTDFAGIQISGVNKTDGISGIAGEALLFGTKGIVYVASSNSHTFVTGGQSRFIIANSGLVTITSQLRLDSTITNGTYTYTLPSATGTLALTSALGSYLPLAGGTLTGTLNGTYGSFSGTTGSVLTGYSLGTGTGVNGYVVGTGFGVKGSAIGDGIGGSFTASGTQAGLVAVNSLGTGSGAPAAILQSYLGNPLDLYGQNSGGGSARVAYFSNTGGLFVSGGDDSHNINLDLTTTTTGHKQGIIFSNGTINRTAIKQEIMNYGASEFDLVFYNGASLNERMRIASSGAVTLTGSLTGTSASFSGSINLTGAANSFQIASIFRNANRVFFGGDTGGYLFQNSANTTTLFQITDAGAATFTGSLSGTSATFSGNGSSFGSASAGVHPLTIQTNVSEQSIKFIGKNDNNNIQFFASNGSTYQAVVGTLGNDFIIGTGASGTERIRITSGGNVLIGTTTDAGYKLDVNGTLRATGAATFSSSVTALNFNVGTGADGRISYNGAYGLLIQGKTAATADSAIFTPAGNEVWINLTGTQNSKFFGTVIINSLAGTGSRAVLADASGVLSAPVSDVSVKQNIKTIGYGLNEISKMNPVWFDFIDGYKNYGRGRQNGNIAQEMAKIIPEAVFITPSTGKMGINYDQLHAVYIKAIQELKAEIDILKAK
jgi:hypothetical protein